MRNQRELEEAIAEAIENWAQDYGVYDIDITIEVSMNDQYVEINRIIQN